MLFTSPVFAQASGSVAGMVFSHGRAGMITRSRSTPTNPNTERQRIVRVALAVLAPYWGQTLSAAQRAGWNLYAANVAMTNALGATIFLTGQNHFLRINIVRIQAGIPIVLNAPTIFDLGTFTAPTIVAINEGTQDFDIGFDNTDDWASTTGGFMLVWLGRTTGQGVAYFGGPYRFAGSIVGSIIPPGSPQNFPAPWIVSMDNLAWVSARVNQPDGRLSLPIVLGPHVITPGP